MDKQAKVLDIGCGGGEITREMALRVSHGQVLGTDVSPQMVNLPSINWPIKAIWGFCRWMQWIMDLVMNLMW
ncbi:class I SAM-dependent methyltransferase [Legionella jordanis]|uniref:class I SAM-dependent methyltransferase n=2 Tax=Legionella jordanis TaxID=456 RepID=UPI000A930AB8